MENIIHTSAHAKEHECIINNTRVGMETRGIRNTRYLVQNNGIMGIFHTELHGMNMLNQSLIQTLMLGA